MHTLELKIPPVAVAVLLGAAVWFTAGAFPSLSFAFPGQIIVAFALAVAGVIAGVAGVVAFVQARTTVDPTRPEKASSLVKGGVYRFSRNPMYTGVLLMLAAWTTVCFNVLALLALPAFVAYMNRYQIVPEERALRARFGPAFTAYEKSVRRWL